MENTPVTLEQTATFTVTSPNTKATLTIVHKRTLSNVDANGKLNPVVQADPGRPGTRFKYVDGGITLKTSTSP